MTTLVTGAAGFIGSHVVERLLASGHEVVGLDNFDSFYVREVKEANLAQARDHDAFALVEGDLRDDSVLDSLPRGVTDVIHLAARAGVRPSIERPREYWSVNVDGTIGVLEWMRRRELRDIVFASSSSVYGNNRDVPFSEAHRVEEPISPYAATKRSGELACHCYHHLYGMTTYALRFFTAFGPRQRPDLAIHKFARLLRDGERLPMFGDGSTARDYTYIDDIVEGVLLARSAAIEGPPSHEVFNLGCGSPVRLDTMIRTLSEEMGVSPDVDRLPMQPGDVTRTYADVSKAYERLGYRAETDFRSGIQAFLGWFGGR